MYGKRYKSTLRKVVNRTACEIGALAFGRRVRHAETNVECGGDGCAEFDDSLGIGVDLRVIPIPGLDNLRAGKHHG